MKPIRIGKDEFDHLITLGKKHPGCLAAFSTNPTEQTWPFVTFGLTPEQLREELRKLSPKLDEVVGVFLELPDKHPSGGRFFVDDKGVYWRDRDKRKRKFIEWLPDEPLRAQMRPTPRSYSEYRAKLARQ